MLQGTCRVVGNARAGVWPGCGRQRQALHHFGDVGRQAGDPSRVLTVRVRPEQVAVILEHRAAPRRVHDDGVERFLGVQRTPRGNVPPGSLLGGVLPTHVVHQCAAAAGHGGHDHVGAQPGEQPHCRVVDPRVEGLLHASGEQRHPQLAFARGPVDGTRPDETARDRLPRDHAQHGPGGLGQQPAERAGDPSEAQRPPKARGMGQQQFEQGADQPLEPGAPKRLLDPCPRVVDEVHVVHAGWACRHAGEARQASVHVQHRPGIRRPVVLQHVLDQVDPAPRAVELIPEQYVRRAGGRAESAVHAGPENAVRGANGWVLELSRREVGAHGLRPPCGRD